jgi:hypothetical protein
MRPYVNEKVQGKVEVYSKDFGCGSLLFHWVLGGLKNRVAQINPDGHISGIYPVLNVYKSIACQRGLINK